MSDNIEEITISSSEEEETSRDALLEEPDSEDPLANGEKMTDPLEEDLLKSDSDGEGDDNAVKTNGNIVDDSNDASNEDEEEMDNESEDDQESDNEEIEMPPVGTCEEEFAMLLETAKSLIPKPEEQEQFEKRITKLFGKKIKDGELGEELAYEFAVARISLIMDAKKQKGETQIWVVLSGLIDFIKGAPEIYTEEAAEKERKKLTEDLEGHLKKLEEKIEQWDKKEIDMNELVDEDNSAFMVKTRLVSKYMKYWNTLCHLNGCNVQTDRSVFKKLCVEKASEYPEINKEVQEFLNSKGYLFTPDFHDILKVVKGANEKKSMGFTSEKVNDIAKVVFKFAIRLVKARRNADFQLPSDAVYTDEPDPAETDEELAKKLAENSKGWERLVQIEDEFAAKQMELNLESVEVPDEEDEEEDSSCPEDDDESEEELEDAEDGDKNEESRDDEIIKTVRSVAIKPSPDDVEEEAFFTIEEEEEKKKEDNGEPSPKRAKISMDKATESNGNLGQTAP